MEKTTQIDIQKQIDLAAEALAHIFIQQIMSKKNDVALKEIDNKYGKPSK